jgi:hypothetical protein
VLAKVNSINEQKNIMNVTLLDVVDLGYVIQVTNLELKLPLFGDSVLGILRSLSPLIILPKGLAMRITPQ